MRCPEATRQEPSLTPELEQLPVAHSQFHWGHARRPEPGLVSCTTLCHQGFSVLTVERPQRCRRQHWKYSKRTIINHRVASPTHPGPQPQGELLRAPNKTICCFSNCSCWASAAYAKADTRQSGVRAPRHKPPPQKPCWLALRYHLTPLHPPCCYQEAGRALWPPCNKAPGRT